MNGIREPEEGGTLSLLAEAKAFASIWHRNRMAFLSESVEKAVMLFWRLRFFIPRYRPVLLCGDFPKEAHNLPGVKGIESVDPHSQRKALQESLAEEEIGAPPIQIAYFGAKDRTFTDILSHLDRGWMAVGTSCSRKFMEKTVSPVYEELLFPEGMIYLFDPPPEDLTIEKNILYDTGHCSEGVRNFIIQMKQGEVHLAFQAILAELESGKTVTQPYLSETLKVREKTFRKILEIGRREKRMDLQPYILETPPRVVTLLKNISRWNEASLAAFFDRRDLIGFARYRDIDFLTLNFLSLCDRVEVLSGTSLDPGQPWHLELNLPEKNILLIKQRFLYGFLLISSTDMTAFRYKVEKLLAEFEVEETAANPPAEPS